MGFFHFFFLSALLTAQTKRLLDCFQHAAT